VSDEVRRLSDELARDPASLVFLPLGEALRRQGQLDIALKVAVRGLERHPHNADAHDLLARIAVDRGELERAFDEWDMVLRFAPVVPAREEPAWLTHTLRTGEASPAAPAPRTPDVGPRDREALSRNPRALFADLIGDADQTALLLDADGFVLAGAYLAHDGRDVAQEVGAELSGVSDEAQRAMRHLDLGDWSQIIVETEVASVILAPAALGGLLLVAADRAMPLGSVRRFLDRALARGRIFVGGDA